MHPKYSESNEGTEWELDWGGWWSTNHEKMHFELNCYDLYIIYSIHFIMPSYFNPVMSGFIPFGLISLWLISSFVMPECNRSYPISSPKLSLRPLCLIISVCRWCISWIESTKSLKAYLVEIFIWCIVKLLWSWRDQSFEWYEIYS